MKDITHLPALEAIHFIKCEKCEHYIDLRDLEQVFFHAHDEDYPKAPPSADKGKPVDEPAVLNFDWGRKVLVDKELYEEAGFSVSSVGKNTFYSSCN